jgi:pseudouridine kinase
VADPTSVALSSRLEPYLTQIALLVPNSVEAAVLGQVHFDQADQRQAIDAARRLVGRGVQTAIVTLAEAGVCYATSTTSGLIRAIHTEVIDPTGAGDALSAAVIFALLNGIELDDAVRLGVAAASLTLRYPGAVIPDLSLERLYDQL